MSYIPGTEYRMIPQTAPSAAHGKNYNKLHQRRATMDREFKHMNIINSSPQAIQQLNANIALRQSFLDSQIYNNVQNEYQRLQGRLSLHRDPSLRDGRFLKKRLSALEAQMADLRSKPMIGAEGRFLY